MEAGIGLREKQELEEGSMGQCVRVTLTLMDQRDAEADRRWMWRFSESR